MVHALDTIKLPTSDFSTQDSMVKVSLGTGATAMRPSRTFTCSHTGETFTFHEGDKKTKDDLNKFIAVCNKKKAEGFKTIKAVQGAWKGALQQAPDNEWMILEDTERYGITKPPKPRITPDPNRMMFGRITRVKGDIVYLRDSILGLVPYLKIADSKYRNFPYVPVKDKNGKNVVEPYYAWVIKKEKEFEKENPSLLAKAREKMSPDAIASIQAGKYTYAFDAAQVGQVPLEISNNELLDEARYSLSGDDTRNTFKVISPKAPVFVYLKDLNYVSASPRMMNQGQTVKSEGVASKKFRYRLPLMLNYDSNFFIPVKKLKKLSDGRFEVKETSRVFSIVNDKIIPVSQRIPAGMILSGKVAAPVVEKTFSFVIINDNPKRTIFVKRNHVEEMLSNWEGGDIMDFHGGTLDFAGARVTPSIIGAGIEGGERFVGFDSNADIPADMFDNTKMYFNFESNVQVAENMFDNTKIDLSFDADDDEEVSNAIGDFFKKIFKRKNKEVTREQAERIADPNKVEYSPDEVQVMYEKSGTNRPFKDWLKSDESKTFFNALTNVGYALLLKQSQGGLAPNQTTAPDSTDNYQGDPNLRDDEDKKILGMHPVTFGVVSILGLTAIGIGIYFIAKKGK